MSNAKPHHALSEVARPLADDFHLTLRPSVSLSRQGFHLLMLVFAAISFTAGGFFWAQGAWPVFGFFGLDVVLLYVFFKLNYRDGKRSEVLFMRDGKLVFARASSSGETRQWVFDPYWVRIKLTGRQGIDDEATALILSSHGQYVSVGAFLAPEERASLAAVLQITLANWRNRPTQAA